MPERTQQKLSISNVLKAREKLKKVADITPLQLNLELSERYGCNIYLKREDLQIVRSYKLRGAYNFLINTPKSRLANGAVCASAGNHAQGFAYTCQIMGIKGVIYMPSTTPKQKRERVKVLGRDFVKIVMIGDTFDDANAEAIAYAEANKMVIVPPFDDYSIMEGQATVGAEIIEQSPNTVDIILMPVGGGGFAAGVASYFKTISPSTQTIGVEPAGAPAMQRSIEEGHRVKLERIDKFVDGAAVKMVGEKTFEVCKDMLDQIITVAEGKICTTILELYNEHAIVAEPAGAMTIAVLDQIKDQIKGKNVVCVVSGGNNDVTRMAEIAERSLIHKGLKHYFIIDFPQRAGALADFVNKVLGPRDDISRFEYTKKTFREQGPALVCVEFKSPDDKDALIERMRNMGIKFADINRKALIFNYFV